VTIVWSWFSFGVGVASTLFVIMAFGLVKVIQLVKGEYKKTQSVPHPLFNETSRED
jgi:hypothetical protein